MGKKVVNHIAFELDSLEKKVSEFREYLRNTRIQQIVDDDKRHQEIRIQLLILKELGPIVGSLDDLRKKAETEKTEKTNDLRGDNVLSPLEEGLI
jgi:hypothetical protein